MKKPLIFLLLFSVSCSQFLKPKESFNKAIYLLFGAIGLHSDSSNYPDPVVITPPPTVAYAPGSIYTKVPEAIMITESKVDLPNTINDTAIPVGKIFDIELKLNLENGSNLDVSKIASVQLPEPVTLTYNYDIEKLHEAGFIDEFIVYYYDKLEKEWYPLSDIVIDKENQKVYAKTNHFTPFVLTAVPTPVGTGVAKPPTCINSAMPISGNGNAQWTTFGLNFKYYKDRNYTITSNGDFYELGLNKSLGIATCNGGAPQSGSDFCGNIEDHKLNTNLDYITFTAETNLDVFVMYDSRGSQDASWFVSDGWINTGKKVTTTDAVGFYKVYLKSFNKNEVVRLHGNRMGLPANSSVNTNYWVVIKPKPPEDDQSSCLSSSAMIPDDVANLRGVPGSNKVTLFWSYVDPSKIQNLVIRRKKNFPVSSISDGMPVSGSEITREGYIDSGLDPNTNYFYTVFSYDTNGLLSNGTTLSVKTSNDSDEDGLSDLYEEDPNHIYSTGLLTDKTKYDTDGDGIDDYSEVIGNTDPTNADTSPPVVTQFQLVSGSKTEYPVAFFDAKVSDNGTVVKYLISESSSIPAHNDSRWVSQIPNSVVLNQIGIHNFYFWARDAAGNISNVNPPIQIELTKVKFLEYYLGYNYDTRKIEYYKFDKNSTKFQFLKASSLLGYQFINDIHPSGKFLVASEYDYTINASRISTYRIDMETGEIQSIATVTAPLIRNAKFSFDGNSLVTLGFDGTINDMVRIYSINPSNGSITFLRSTGLSQKNIDYLYLNPNGRYVYVLKGEYGYIQTLDLQNNASIVPNSVSLSGYVGRLEFHYSGKFGYFTNGDGEGSFDVFRMNETTGILYRDRSIQLPDVKQLFQYRISKDGKFLIAKFSDQTDSSWLGKFSINQVDGALTELKRIPINVSYNMELESTGNLVLLSNNTTRIIDLYSTDNLIKVSTQSDLLYPNFTHSIDQNNAPIDVRLTLRSKVGLYKGLEKGFQYPYGDIAGVSASAIFFSPANVLENVSSYYNSNRNVSIDFTVNDPARVSCQKQTSNYLETLIRIPQNADITHFLQGTIGSRKIMNWSISARQDFGLKYTLTDHPGICEGTSQTKSSTLEIKPNRISINYQGLLPMGSNLSNEDEFFFTEDVIARTSVAGAIVEKKPIVITNLECDLVYYECDTIVPGPNDIYVGGLPLINCHERTYRQTGWFNGNQNCSYFRDESNRLRILTNRIKIKQDHYWRWGKVIRSPI